MNATLTYEELLAENQRLREQLEEATETIHAIRTGQVDALVVTGDDGHELYTLKTADQTYRVFIETMNEGAVTLSAGGLIVYGNSMFATMVGLPLSQVIGLSFDNFVAAQSLSAYQQLVEMGWTDKHRVEMTLCDHTDHAIPCLLSVTALELDEGPSLSVIITDLTSQKETQQLLSLNNEQLKLANRALEISNNALNLSNDNLQQFAYVASHDLQEPLRKIRSFGELLKADYGANLGDEGHDLITRMNAAAARMTLLIKDLLDYSRLTMQQVPFKPVSLDSLLTDVLDDLSVSVAEWGAVIDRADLPVVQGDKVQLRQLFQNLLSNALKFHRTDVSPHIRVSARRVVITDLPAAVQNTIPPSSVANQVFHEISVADNGIGFDEKYLDRIFQVFQRLHGRRIYPGSGVGLAICRKVANNHRGELTAESKPGVGSTFKLFLPA
ncbi:ATP-binding protein [Fibrella sp. WM1]|uniref:sensor histidine kinase n=1 Tax=Fibrella musci TaxID=3242485 RepID=UPI0035213068